MGPPLLGAHPVSVPSSGQPPEGLDLRLRAAEQAGACPHTEGVMSDDTGQDRRVGRPSVSAAGWAEERAGGSLWPCAAAAGTRAVARGRGSSRRRGPRAAAGSHSTRCRGSPCTCSGCPATSPSPGRGQRQVGAPPPPRKARPAGERPLDWGSEDVGPSTSCVTPGKVLSSPILSFFVESVR